MIRGKKAKDGGKAAVAELPLDAPRERPTFKRERRALARGLLTIAGCLFLTGARQFQPAGPSFVQRYWYLAQPRLLILDEWDTPGLDKILAKAEWS